MDIKYLNTNDLKPYPQNAKKHPDDQVEHIANSIREFGFKQPIVIDQNNVVIIGHGRLLASKKIGLKEVPCVIADDLTEEQIKALRLADNKTNESEWDLSFLDDELNDIFDIDMSLFGFDLDLGDEETEIVEDDVPEDAETRCQLGDLWQLGNHRLICGDSTDPATIDRLMGEAKADMVFTDPPYGVAIGDKNETLNSVQPSGRCTENIIGDTMDEQTLYETLNKAFVNIREHSKDDCSYYVTSPQGGSLGLMMMMMRDAGLTVRHVLMWVKNSATFSLGRLDYDYQHEPIFYTWTKSHHNYRGGASALLFGM